MLLRYGSALQQLTELLLCKVRFATNADELALIEHDTEGLSDGEHTEWDLFIGKTTQLLSKVSHYYIRYWETDTNYLEH